MENYINQLIAHASKDPEASSAYQDAFRKRFSIREKELPLVDIIEIAIRKAARRKKSTSVEDMAKNLLGEKANLVAKVGNESFCVGYIDYFIDR